MPNFLQGFNQNNYISRCGIADDLVDELEKLESQIWENISSMENMPEEDEFNSHEYAFEEYSSVNILHEKINELLRK